MQEMLSQNYLDQMLAKDTTLQRKLLTVKQCLEKFPFIKNGTLRYWIFQADSKFEPNGFASVIFRVGGSVYLDENRLWKWLHAKNAKLSLKNIEMLLSNNDPNLDVLQYIARYRRA